MMYINALLEVFNENNGMYVIDERACFRSAGLKRFAEAAVATCLMILVKSV